MSLSIQATKLTVALIIFLCGIVSTSSPLFIVETNAALFSAGNMMASGVLLAAGLVHQLPDSSASSLDQQGDGFPWSFFICGLTFLLFLVFEESVHLLLLAGNHSNHGEDGTKRSPMVEMEGPHAHYHHHSCQGSITIPGLEQFLNVSVIEEDKDYGTSTTANEQQPLKKRRASNDEIRHSFATHRPSRRSSKFSVTVFGEPREQSNPHHHHDDHISEHLHGSLLASLMLLMALSVHSVLAGLSIGMVHDAKDIYSTTIAIVAHKVFAGYALGSTMAASDLGYDRCIFLGIIFSLSTPLGIFIGMGLDSYDEDSSSIGIVQAIVAGTFLYVSIMEVGMKELLICRHNEGPLQVSLSQKQLEALKLFSLLVGFLGMSYLAVFV